MKYASLSLLTLLLNMGCFAMDNQLTDTEKACYDWFVEQQKSLPSTMTQLSEEDRSIFNKQVKYQDSPDAVTRSRHSFAEVFYASAQNANPNETLLYDKKLLKTTFVKMTRMMHGNMAQAPTDLITTRMWAFSNLSSEEKMTYSPDVYGKDPEATMGVVIKWSDVVCNKLIELKLLTAEQKAGKQQELLAEVKARFEKQYENK